MLFCSFKMSFGGHFYVSRLVEIQIMFVNPSGQNFWRKNMHSDNTVASDVSALLHSYSIDLQHVDRKRMVDEYGHVGRGRFADDFVDYLDSGGLRLIIRHCSEQGDMWFEIEIGNPCGKADSVSEHCVRITFMELSNEDGEGPTRSEWSLKRFDSPEAEALLKKIDPHLAALCSRKDEWMYHLPESFDRTASNKAFFFTAIDNVFQTFAAAGSN